MKDFISICNKLKKINRNGYIIGSFCVSKALGIKHYGDLDMATDALPEEIESCLNVVGSIGKKYGTYIIKEGGLTVEITTFRKDIGSINSRRPVKVEFTDNMKEDAERRDFTINSIYYDPLEDKFIDPFDGLKDLHARVIRFVGDANKRLDEDMLRLLRFVRLKCKLGLKDADDNYDVIIKKRIKELNNISIERIKEELDKILLSKLNVEGLKYLKEIGFFKEFIPEVDALSETKGGPKHHLEGDVWIHTLMVIEELNKLKVTDLDLYWVGLLHDIGKYHTFSIDENGNVHYYNHDSIGEELFKKNISKKFRFSKDSSEKIAYIIKNHLKIALILDMKKLKAYKFIQDKYFKDLIVLLEADSLGKTPPKSKCCTRKIEEFYAQGLKKLSSIPFLTGNDIMKKYPDLKGKDIGKKLQEENDNLILKYC